MKTEDFSEPKVESIIEDPLKIEPILSIKTELKNIDPLIIDVGPSSRTNWIKLEPESADELDSKVPVSGNCFKNELNICGKKSTSKCKQRKYNHVCAKCQNTFYTEKSLLKHKKRCNQCDECNESFKSKKSLIFHKDTIHSKTWICQKCNKCFKTEKSLSTHKQFCKNCDECNELLTSKKAFILHMDSIHSKTWNCEKCDRDLKDYKSYLIHLKRTHGNGKRTFLCKICKNTTMTKGGLERHIKILHYGVLMYKCDSCEKSFKYSQDLKLHTNIIHKGLKFPCDQCSRVFDLSHSLYKHRKFKHLKILKFECDICEKRFTEGDKLKKHMVAKHSNQTYQQNLQKAFQCQLCRKGFASKDSLKRHIAILHHGFLQSKCNLCEKSFKYSKDLKLHINSIHHGMKFPCNICSIVFDLPNSLYKHKRFKHLTILKYE